MDIEHIRQHFKWFEEAYRVEFGYDFGESGGVHAPSPFSKLERCIGALIENGEISRGPAMVLGFGDARVIAAFDYHGIEAYGLEKDQGMYWIGTRSIRILKDRELTHPEGVIALGMGDFHDPNAYEPLCVHPSSISTFYHYAGTGEFSKEQAVAHLVSRESGDGTVFLLANHNNMAHNFEGLSCKRTYRLWGKEGSREGMFVHVYQKSSAIHETRLKRKKALMPV